MNIHSNSLSQLDNSTSKIKISINDFNYVQLTLKQLLLEQKNWPISDTFIYWRDEGTLDERKLAILILSCKLLEHEKDLSKRQCTNILSFMDSNKDDILL